MAKDIDETLPEVKPAQSEKMLTINIDPQETDGGLVINGKRYIGEYTLPEPIARQMLENVAQYKEVKNKMFDPNQKIREKNIFNIEQAYMADPSQHRGNSGFTQEFGVLDPWQWQFVHENEKYSTKSNIIS